MSGIRLTVCLLLCGAAALAQNQQGQAADPASPAPAAQEPEVFVEREFVRRISFGVAGTVTPLKLFPEESRTFLFPEATPLEIRSNNNPVGTNGAGGFVAQFAVSDRWALAVSPFLRRAKYKAFTIELRGVDNPNTSVEERAGTNIDENTTAWFLDLPILMRIYSKDRFEEGARFFGEFGPTLRMVYNVKTTRSILLPTQKKETDNTPAEHRSRATGMTAGFGVQLIDPFGIRVTPGVRYTRWLTHAFDNVGGRTRANQIEIMLTLGF